MKRQLLLGFTGALMVGVGLVLGACNKHSLVDGKFDKGVKNLYKHHGDDEHGDDHGHEAEPGDHKGHDSDKGGSHDGGKGGGHDGQTTPNGAQGQSPSPPAKTLFPKK
jgi:hypothetical protein